RRLLEPLQGLANLTEQIGDAGKGHVDSQITGRATRGSIGSLVPVPRLRALQAVAGFRPFPQSELLRSDWTETKPRVREPLLRGALDLSDRRLDACEERDD